MYAVVRIAGHQYQVRPESRLRVPRLAVEAGAQVTLDDVLAIAETDDGAPILGTPRVEGAQVVARVLEHDREPTIRIFHKKRRKDHRKLNGHRQPYSEIQIEAIHVSGAGR